MPAAVLGVAVLALPWSPRRLASVVVLLVAAAALVACSAGGSPSPSNSDDDAGPSAPSPSSSDDGSGASATPIDFDPTDRIAFGRWEPGEDRDHPPALWTMAADGSDQRPVGDQHGWYMEWSPDHTHLLFNVVDADGNDQIATMKLDGSDYTQLTAGPGFYGDPAYSPDGELIAFVYSTVGENDTGFRPHLWVMDADGGNQHALGSRQGGGKDFEPVFSPDGSKIVFTGAMLEDDTVSAIYIVNADGTDLYSLTSYAHYREHPRWSPDGTTIIFNVERLRAGAVSPPNGIWTVPAAGDGDPTLLLPADHKLMPFKPGYSSDGSQILFGCAHVGTPSEDLCMMNADGTDVHVIVATPEIENHGVWW